MRTAARSGTRERRRETVGGLLVAASALLFGVVVILAKIEVASDIRVFGMLAIRFGIAALILAGVLAVLRRPLAAASGERLGIVVIGIAGYAVEASFFFSALPHGTAAAVTLLFFTYPVFVTLASWGLGRGRPSRLTVAALACAVAGAGVVVGTGGGISIQRLGIVLAFGSALTYTAYLIGADHVLKRTNSLTAAMWQAGSASAGLLVFALVSGGFEGPSNWHEWWPILGMGLATAGAFVCLLEGLQRLGSVRTSIISAGEPLAASVLAFLFLRERVGVGVALGGVLIVIGAVAASMARTASAPAESSVP